MQIEEQETKGLSPREAFLKAKIEHYLDRAEECFQMSRYHAALRVLDSAYRLDPENPAADQLRQSIHDGLRLAGFRTNGESEGHETIVHPNRRSELIMIVDQDERVLTSLTATFHRYGFRTVGAGGYEEALETLTEIHPDVIISEVNFESGPRGFDLYNWLKTNGQHADVPFMFLAARLDKEILIAGKRFGVDDFILKPVDDEVVATMVVSCLSRHKRIPA